MAVGRIRSRSNWRAVALALQLMTEKPMMERFRPALLEAGVAILGWMRTQFKTLAASVWPKISWITYVLSAKRINGSINSWQQVETGRKAALPLIDTGNSFDSLFPGGRYNVFSIENHRLTAGSNNPILLANQRERTEKFVFGPAEELRLAHNVPPYRGSKSNSIFYQMRTILRKKSGQDALVPARPLFDKNKKVVPDSIIRRLQKRIVEEMKVDLVARLRAAKKDFKE